MTDATGVTKDERRKTKERNPSPFVLRPSSFVPGVALSTAIALAAWGIQVIEEKAAGQAVIE